MNNFMEAFTYFANKSQELREKYNISYFEISPCSITSKEDLISFIQELIRTLFREADFQIIENLDINNTEDQKVDFLFNSQLFSFEIDSKYGHIELGFFKTIKLLGKLSGKMVSHINPTAAIVVGDIDKMILAWNEGFPIHIDGVDFLHKNISGKRFKKEEVKSKFYLNQKIDLQYYEQTILEGLNTFLLERKKELHYSREQIKLYKDHRSLNCISLNGDYQGSFRIGDNKTVFDNRFINQIFLANHWSKEDGKDLNHVFQNGDRLKVTIPFIDYILTLGVRE